MSGAKGKQRWSEECYFHLFKPLNYISNDQSMMCTVPTSYNKDFLKHTWT